MYTLSVKELNNAIREFDDRIAELKSYGLWTGKVEGIQRVRDKYYDRLCEIDGLTPKFQD